MQPKIKDAIRWVSIRILEDYIKHQIAIGKMEGGWSEQQITEMAEEHVDKHRSGYVS